MKDNSAYLLSIDDILIAMRLARLRGKKAGESFQQELEEVFKKHKKEPAYLGSIDDPEMLGANLRENGYFKETKVLDLRKALHKGQE